MWLMSVSRNPFLTAAKWERFGNVLDNNSGGCGDEEE
jgi:hypothetical protein